MFFFSDRKTTVHYDTIQAGGVPVVRNMGANDDMAVLPMRFVDGETCAVQS